MLRYVIYLLILELLLGAKSMEELPLLQLNPLTENEAAVILHKGTERAFSGELYKHKESGVYHCKQCDAPLYNSTSKFESGTGWPSFDDAIEGSVKRIKDADGRRMEIVCANCGGHLGHVFYGEGFTPKNTRYCVNSLSLKFEKAKAEVAQKAYFAGGCFWGVEYFLEQADGVIEVKSGYMGGRVKNPTYADVSSGRSGHLEVVEVSYDEQKVNYETLAKLFFEIHDPEQRNGQGPDIGTQYLSALFVNNEKERQIAQNLIKTLEQKGYKIATKILPKEPFYEAEAYHQDYYKHKGSKPYCHGYVKRF